MFLIVIIHRNDNLLPRQTFCCYINVRFWFTITFDNFLNVFDVFRFESRKHFFDFEDFLSIAFCQRSLSVRFTRICLSLGWFRCLEIFGDLFDLFGRFCGDGRRNSLNTCWLVSIFFPILTILGRSGELMRNFLSESVIMTVSKEQVPFRAVKGEHEFSGGLAYTFEIINFIGLKWFDFFVFYIFGHADQRFLYIVRVRRKML